jgi:hydroxypyruvate reductase
VSQTSESENIGHCADFGYFLALLSFSSSCVICDIIIGGGSALLCAPAPGLTLEDIQATNKVLLRAGADIHGL